MISDDEIEKALDYLRDSAKDAAQAKANRIYLEEYRKCLKAKLFNAANDKMSIAAREAYAYDHLEYRTHIEALKEAVFEDEKGRFLRVAAEAKIEAWRSLSANIRGMRV